MTCEDLVSRPVKRTMLMMNILDFFSPRHTRPQMSGHESVSERRTRWRQVGGPVEIISNDATRDSGHL